MAYKKTLPVKLLSLMLVFVIVFFSSMSVSANDLYDTYSGEFKFTNDVSFGYLSFAFDRNTDAHSSVATYFGSNQCNLRFHQVQGYVYTGQAVANVTYTLDQQLISSDVYAVSLSNIVMHDLQLPDGISVVMEYVTRNSYSTTVRYRIIFSNYQAPYSGYAYLSWINDISCLAIYNNSFSIVGLLSYGVTSDLSYNDALFEYVNISDVPSYDGENNKQNEQMIQNQEKANELQEEANETSKGILSKITEFFSGFFTNLGNTVLSWIVPTSEQLTEFLTEVNEWFSARLGFIWYPFNLAIQLVNALAGGSANSKLTIPALSLNLLGTSYQIWSPIEVDLDAFGIFKYVRYFTDVILVAGVAKLAYDKWDEWIGGHGVG